MRQILNATYSKGVLKPEKRLKLPEGSEVKLTIESREDAKVEKLLKLAGRVYKGLTEKQIQEIERIALDRNQFFSNK